MSKRIKEFEITKIMQYSNEKHFLYIGVVDGIEAILIDKGSCDLLFDYALDSERLIKVLKQAEKEMELNS